MIDVLLLFMEEIGELSKAIRIDQGLKVTNQGARQVKTIGAELADCLIYLVNIANLSNVNLDKALREKEGINKKRNWESKP